MQEHRDEERSQPFNLPMGGLLSELLASEGIDAGEFAAAETANDSRIWPVCAQPPDSPVPGSPPALVPRAEPDIVLPGLLRDLLKLADAAETLPLPATPPPEPPAVPVADPVQHPAELARAPENGNPELPGEPELPVLAIPGLLSLLSADAECTGEPECAPETEPAFASPADSESPAFQSTDPVQAAALPAECLPALNGSVFDELEIEDTAEPAVVEVHPPVEESVAADGEALPISAAGEPDILAAGQPDILAAGQLDILEQPPEAVLAVTGPADAEPEVESEPEYSPAEAAAALAEAAGHLVREAIAGSGGSLREALAGLTGDIGGASAASLDRQPAVPPEACERYVVFQLGEQSYGLHITCVREVEKVGRVTSVPGAPPMIRGLINLHGEILPLVDPRPLLAMPAGDAASGGYLVVVHRSGELGAMAWMVDGLGGMALVDPAAQKRGETANQGAAGIVLGSADHRGRRLLLLDGHRLASEEAVEEAAEQWAVMLEESQK